MIYGSVCSGIEAASCAWMPLGWRPAWFSEIDPFCSALLEHYHPDVPNLGNMEQIDAGRVAAVDVLVGGTPCQSFSVAGLRGGMDDARGNLAAVFCRLARDLRPRWVVWENVPGVLSSHGGRDFGSIVGALEQFGYGICWRILDARHFGVPQRRRRIFLVGHLGDWRRAAAVLLEPHGLRRDPAPGRGARQDVAGTLVSRTRNGGSRTANLDTPLVMADGEGGSGHLTASALAKTVNNQTPLIFDPTQITHPENRARDFSRAPALAQSAQVPVLAYNIMPTTGQGAELTATEADAATSLSATAEAAKTERGARFVTASGVRRITPRETERLMGFPDDYTLIPYRGAPAKDAPRYRALGNSMVVPVMRWIGRRIQLLEDTVPTGADRAPEQSATG